MSDRPVDFREQRHAGAHVILAGTARALGLLRRVPALLKRRGWPQDPDLVAVLVAAVALRSRYAGATVIRRPAAAGGCGGKWPPDLAKLTASQVVARLELDDLLHP